MQEPLDLQMDISESNQHEFDAIQIRFLPTLIEFVRNRFVYDKTHYSKIEEVQFKKGYLNKNRWVIRVIATFVVFFLIRFLKYGLDQTANFQETNSAFWFNKGAIISVWGPVIFMLGALLAFYQSFKKSTVVIIKTSEYKRSVSIPEIDKKGQTDRLIAFLKSKNVLVSDKRSRY